MKARTICINTDDHNVALTGKESNLNSHFLMTRRQFLHGSVLVAGAAILPQTHRAYAASNARPNLVVIVTDQQHWEAIGFVDSYFDTPNLDGLARESVVFKHAFCTTPQCSPSRASIYTGLYPHRTGVLGNIHSVDHTGELIPALPEGTETLGSRLQDAGYHTAYYGKWHLGNGEYFNTHFDSAHLDIHPDSDVTTASLAYLDSRTADGAVEKPFALFVNYLNPHDIYEFGFFDQPGELPVTDTPVSVPHPASWADTFENKPVPQQQFMLEDQGEYFVGKPDTYWEHYRRVYRDKCKQVDTEIGKVLEHLDSLGLRDNTIVVFCSDHGDMDTHNRLVYKGPFMYEHCIRVPLMVRIPEALGGRHQVSDDFVLLTDLAPTLMEFAGVPWPNRDGQSLCSFLMQQGPLPSRSHVTIQYFNKQRWVNPIRTLRTKQFKLNVYQGHMDELYDVRNDPNELVNLINDPGYAASISMLRELLDNEMRQMDDTSFGEYWPTDRHGNRL